ncbi:deoxycytidylate deaminase [Cytobacillus gottheilii]|uniref:deoxycytidylate deaminase n=1 Tax=Cytobacillus gottheilii TaxID=859144 RepID=UPI0021489FCF|nr:dCMP deaminase family protein [Cytobacillus gottheilii]
MFKFNIENKLILNTKRKDLSKYNGELVEVVEIIDDAITYDYIIKIPNQPKVRVRENELQEVKDENILQLRTGQRVIYTPLDVTVTVEQLNLLYGQISVRFPDGGVQVVGLELIKVEEIPQRKSWDEYFMDIAIKVSTRATCDRLHVGCVIVKDKQIVSTGYNGSVSGEKHCDEIGHLYNDQNRCIRTIHAEQNAILFADRNSLKGATAYVTHKPCENCAKLLVQAGIVRLIYLHEYENTYSDYFLKMIESEHMKGALV